MIFLAPPSSFHTLPPLIPFWEIYCPGMASRPLFICGEARRGIFLHFSLPLKHENCKWNHFSIETNARTYCSFGFLCLYINNPDICIGGGNKPSISLFIPKILQRRRNLLRVWMQFDIKMENGKKAKVWIGALSLQNKGDLYTQGFGRKCNGRPIITLPPRLDWRQSVAFLRHWMHAITKYCLLYRTI